MTIPLFTKGETLSASELNTALSDAAAQAVSGSVTAVQDNANTFTEPQTFDGTINQSISAGANNQTPFAQYGDLFSDAIMSGLTTTTSSTLSSTLESGDAYVIGQRVVYPGGDYTVAASSTSYLDLSDTGVLTVSTSATVTENSLRLWEAVSSATAITGVTQVAPSGIVANASVSGPAGTSRNQFINYTQMTNFSLSPNFGITTVANAVSSGNATNLGQVQELLNNYDLTGYVTTSGVTSPFPVGDGVSGTDAVNYTQITNGSLSPTFGNITSSGNLSVANYQMLQGSISTPKTSGWIETINLANGTVQLVTLNSNGTLAFSGVAPNGYACSVKLYLEQGANGNATVIWPSGMTIWPNGTPPILSTEAGAIDVVTLTTFNGGASWFGRILGEDMAVANFIFVAVAYGSTHAAYSTNGGQTWTLSTLPSSADWESVAYGNSTFVAVASSSTDAAYSTNGGQTWTASTLPSSADWKSVAYGNSTFVAVASSSTDAAYSTNDGQTWTASTLPSSAYWYSVAFGG